jgi:myo-inositol-1(or 4)-monophosphatase
MNADINALVELARSMAHEAGLLVKAGRSRGLNDVVTKSTPTDVVTEFDRAAEALIVNRLRSERPDDGLIGEEGTNDPGTSGIHWLIDPIDGTTNFLYDLPAYAVSVAAADNLGPVAGAVYLPVTDEMFWAGRGTGAWRNGTPIHCSAVDDLALALVGTGFAYRAERRVVQAATMARIIPEIRDFRRFGSAAVDLCYVACGRLDVYFEQWLNPWDRAAGELIATEAGALVGDYRTPGDEPDGLLAAPRGLYDAIRNLIESD